jgi:hypothetical protein
MAEYPAWALYYYRDDISRKHHLSFCNSDPFSSIISHWSALQHHGLTEQVPQIITASTPTKVVAPSMREKELHELKLKHIWQIADIRYEYTNIKQKIFFGNYRFSEDLDFSVINAPKDKPLENILLNALVLAKELLNEYGSFDIQLKRNPEKSTSPKRLRCT